MEKLNILFRNILFIWPGKNTIAASMRIFMLLVGGWLSQNFSKSKKVKLTWVVHNYFC